jgi:ABC-type multidrug transport system fused ATPase/permease subunit
MNIDELKTAWSAYDTKLRSSQLLSEKIISSMITERSSSRFSKVKRNYVIGLAWMIACLLIGFAILFGNPFDYKWNLQYVPIIIYCTCLTILIGALVVSLLHLKDITITHHNIDESLRKIIAVYERPGKFLKYTVILFLFSQLFLFPLSFLPASIERRGLWGALVERFIPISISALILWIAYKLGAFKERYGKKFKDDLSELEELKAIAAELREDQRASA